MAELMAALMVVMMVVESAVQTVVSKVELLGAETAGMSAIRSVGMKDWMMAAWSVDL